MIPETAMWIAVGANAGFFAAKFFAFRLKAFAQLPELPGRQLPPPLPTISKQNQSPEIKPKPAPAIEQTISPIVVRPEKAVQLLIRYLQDSKCTGVFAASEIDEFWDMASAALNLDRIPYGTIRSQLQGIPGVFLDRRSLSIEYREVRRRTGMTRAVLYRIPDRGRPLARTPSSDQAGQTADVAAPCQRPAIDEKSSQVRRAA